MLTFIFIRVIDSYTDIFMHFMPLRQCQRRALYFHVIRPCVLVSVRLYVIYSVMLFPWCLWYALLDFTELLSVVCLGIKMNWLGFEVKRSKDKGQSQSMTKIPFCGLVSAISPVCVDGFAPNFCRLCILQQRWTGYVLAVKSSKVKLPPWSYML